MILKKTPTAIFTLLTIISSVSSFDLQSYQNFLDQNSNLSEVTLINDAKSGRTYYSKINDTEKHYLYLDSIKVKYGLTSSELDMLNRNNFVVTERQSFYNFGTALRDIFNKDLPVFLTTDAVLYTLHLSYDAVLIQLEKSTLEPAVKEIISRMRQSFLSINEKYAENGLSQNLADVDLYLTIASSMINGTKETPVISEQTEIDRVLDAISDEQYVTMPLFTETTRDLDFSQFKVRGHYVQENLGNYFKAMMWLGRTEFLLSSPKQGDMEMIQKKDISRMTIDAALLSEILDESGADSKLAKIDSLLSFFIGESDNLTPDEFATILKTCNINKADDLLTSLKLDSLSAALTRSPEAGQKILSQVIMTDSDVSDTLQLPVSFLLMGQKYIVDSYIFGNVIYDKIMYNNEKMKRLMPDPLDVMFSLGNDDAATLLKPELEKWHYAPQLNNMRYLVDSYDSEFWRGSLYNSWLNTLRALNPSVYPDAAKQPLFMRSAAWHQKMLNTQLVSWAQLRHDNLLYAKQSYTPGIECSYPHGYVEPYPSFYREIGLFAKKAAQFLAPYSGSNQVSFFYNRVASLMDTLTSLAEKELARQPFSKQDSTFMANMLVTDNICGAPITAGWYGNLIYREDMAESEDFTIADIHTQPTDEYEVLVGKVLHVGVGKINLGIFLAESPSSDYKPMAYVGPVASYYQKITDKFLRHTDEEWAAMVDSNKVPERPDWVNCFLINRSGAELAPGRTLEGVLYSTSVKSNLQTSSRTNFEARLHGNSLLFTISKDAPIQISFYDLHGRMLFKPVNKVFKTGNHTIGIPAASGVFTAVVKYNGNTIRLPLIAIK